MLILATKSPILLYGTALGRFWRPRREKKFQVMSFRQHFSATRFSRNRFGLTFLYALTATSNLGNKTLIYER